MGRNNHSQRFPRERSIDTREIAIRFLIVSEDTKSSTDYFKALIKEVQAACSGSEVVGISKDSVVEGCGMSTSRLLQEAKSIKSRRQISFDRCWLVFDKDDFSDFNRAIKEATDAGFDVARASSSGISFTSDIITLLFLGISVQKPLRQKYRSTSPALGTIRVTPPCTPSSLSMEIKVKP